MSGSKTLKIGNFEERKNYRIYNALPDYKRIEGVFATYDEMITHLSKCRFNFALDTKIVELNGKKYLAWQCPTCKEWGNKTGVNNSSNICQNCREYFKDCHSYEADLYRGSIYTSGGGSVSICSTLASLSFE